MPDYQNGKIYKIIGGGLVYYGSTTQDLKQRFSIHLNDKKRGKNLSVNSVLGLIDCKIELIEDFPCHSKKELLWRERFFIDNSECVNRNIPILSIEEIKYIKKIYQQNHKESVHKSNKKWEDANKEKRKLYHKEWYILNKEKVALKYQQSKL
tara:strand:- start:38 stop:493 length:456 start_codon:yes stop_codon:yes gene_type:complete